MTYDLDALERIARALERLSPPAGDAPDLDAADAFVWHTGPDRLQPVQRVNRVALELLVGIGRSRDTLLANTLQFARGSCSGFGASPRLWPEIGGNPARRFAKHRSPDGPSARSACARDPVLR